MSVAAVQQQRANSNGGITEHHTRNKYIYYMDRFERRWLGSSSRMTRVFQYLHSPLAEPSYPLDRKTGHLFVLLVAHNTALTGVCGIACSYFFPQTTLLTLSHLMTFRISYSSKHSLGLRALVFWSAILVCYASEHASQLVVMYIVSECM